MNHAILTPHGASVLPPLAVTQYDDPRAVAEASKDDYALHVVPNTWRLSRAKMVFAWSALLTTMFWIVVAATAAIVVGTVQTIIGMILAAVAHSFINYNMQKAAAQSGLTVALFSRSLFGYYGASIAAIIFASTATLFGVFESAVLATAFKAYLGGPIQLWYVLVTLYCVPLVFGGIRVWLERLNKWLLPVFAIGLIGAVVWATLKYGYNGNWLTAPALHPIALAGPGWLYVFAIYMGVFSQMLFTFDFGRMGRALDTTFNGWVTFGPVYYSLAFIVNGLVGIYLANTIPVKGGVSEISVVIGLVQMMGIFGLIFIAATQTKINSANLYLASSNLESFFSRAIGLTLPRTVWVGVVGLIMLAILFANIFSFILTWLSYQGVVLVAWTAVALVHIANADKGVRKMLFEFRPGRVPSVNPGGVCAWGLASIVGIILVTATTPFTHIYALPITFVLSASIYWISLRAARPGWFVLSRPHDPIDEIADAWTDHILCETCKRSYVAMEIDRDPTNNHHAICASCATGHVFRSAAISESNAYRQQARITPMTTP